KSSPLTLLSGKKEATLSSSSDGFAFTHTSSRARDAFVFPVRCTKTYLPIWFPAFTVICGVLDILPSWVLYTAASCALLNPVDVLTGVNVLLKSITRALDRSPLQQSGLLKIVMSPTSMGLPRSTIHHS